MKIAITGTKGKTTIMYLIKHVLRELNKNVIAVSSTEGVYYNEEFLYDPRMSQYLVRESKRPYDYQVSEATSKLLKYNKYTSADIDIAAFNGIEKHEHLETHKTFYNYLTAKKKLFDLISNQQKIAVLNSNDPYYVHMIKDFKGLVSLVGVGSNADYQYTILNQTSELLRLKIKYFTGTKTIKLPITGYYNAHNAAMAFAILNKCGIDPENIRKNLETFKGVPGRFQKIQLHDGRLIIVDYAHSEESLKLVLNHIKEIYPDRPIITVFGCGGDRTNLKRGPMGKVATENSKFVYITNDNPRSEKPSLILNDIRQGISKSNFSIIPDRADAIKAALRFKQNTNNIFLIAGKGAEIKNLYGRKTYNLTDEQRIKKACKELNIMIK